MRRMPSRALVLAVALGSVSLVSCPPATSSSPLLATHPSALDVLSPTTLADFTQTYEWTRAQVMSWMEHAPLPGQSPTIAQTPSRVAANTPAVQLAPITPEIEDDPPPTLPAAIEPPASNSSAPIARETAKPTKATHGDDESPESKVAQSPDNRGTGEPRDDQETLTPSHQQDQQVEKSNDYQPAPYMLTATARQAWVYKKPNPKSRKIGYLRAGAVVARHEKPAGRHGCRGGWYQVDPKGFVCVGRNAALRGDGPIALAGRVRPNRSQGLPYIYGMSKYPPPPLYARLPSVAEQRKAEQNAGRRRIKTQKTGFEDVVGVLPAPLVYGTSMPRLDDKHPASDLIAGTPAVRSGFGILQVFSWTDRLFGVTTDLKLIPMDRLRRIRGSSMQGIHFEPGTALPAAFVKSRIARKYAIDPTTKAIRDAGPIRFREGFSLTGKRLRLGKHVYLETRQGVYIRQTERVVVIPPMKNVPGWAKRGRKWVDVSILRQTLVAYEGTTPVFATLVSTGVDGLGDPEETHSTIRGVFLIHTKHVSVTMDNDEEGDVYDLRDVPYVQYFMDGYALHAAYWHDDFGTPHSHGCINLAPKDAAWLFRWTDPKVPQGWHGRLQLRGGTIVYTHA